MSGTAAEHPKNAEASISFEARSALSSYFVLCGIWLILAAMNVVIFLTRPNSLDALGVSAFCVLVSLLWAIWLRGFRIRIAAEELEYRNGLYRSTTVPFEKIRGVKHVWIKSGRGVPVPRLAIICKTPSNRIVVNTKPFRKADIQLVIRTIKEHIDRCLPGDRS